MIFFLRGFGPVLMFCYVFYNLIIQSLINSNPDSHQHYKKSQPNRLHIVNIDLKDGLVTEC